MKILIAGASGAIGRHLVPRLVARGHEVVGTTRSATRTGALAAPGAEPVILDARAIGVRTFVAQSNAIRVERTGRPVTDESARLEPNPPGDAKSLVAALRHLEETVTGIDWATGIALRYGSFYGPGTGIEAAPDAAMAGLISRPGASKAANCAENVQAAMTPVRPN